MNKLTRRRVMSQAGVGAGLAVMSLRAGQQSVPQPKPVATRIPSFWSAEDWASKREVSLYMLQQAPGRPGSRAEAASGAIPGPRFSISGRSSFDLTVPGRGEYSVMNIFAKAGFDVGIRAGAYAMARPDRVQSLVLTAFTYKGENAPTLTERAKQLDYYRTHNRRLRDLEMIRSIYTRDKTGTADPAEAQAAVELKFGDQVPTGTYLDMTANLPLVDPTRVLCPVLMLRGEYDGIATMKDLSEFFNALPNGNRQFVVLPGTAHAVSTGLNRHLAWHVMLNFLNMPEIVKAP